MDGSRKKQRYILRISATTTRETDRLRCARHTFQRAKRAHRPARRRMQVDVSCAWTLTLRTRTVSPRQAFAIGVRGHQGPMATAVHDRLTSVEGRRFGLTLGSAFLAFATIALWRGRPNAAVLLGSIGLVLAIAGFFIPTRLAPVQRHG